MGDVTAGQLAAALNGKRMRVRVEAATGAMGTSPAFATLIDPALAAKQILDEIGGHYHLPQSTSPGDPELEALDVIVVELARLAVLGEDAVARVMRYLVERYLT